MKVTFCNEWHDIARTFGVDCNELRETWLADPRISRDHTFVHPDDRGFGGKCLPKDTSAIIAAALERGCSPPLLESVMRINSMHRTQDPAYAPYRNLFACQHPVASVAAGCSSMGPSRVFRDPDPIGNDQGDH